MYVSTHRINIFYLGLSPHYMKGCSHHIANSLYAVYVLNSWLFDFCEVCRLSTLRKLQILFGKTDQEIWCLFYLSLLLFLYLGMGIYYRLHFFSGHICSLMHDGILGVIHNVFFLSVQRVCMKERGVKEHKTLTVHYNIIFFDIDMMSLFNFQSIPRFRLWIIMSI